MGGRYGGDINGRVKERHWRPAMTREATVDEVKRFANRSEPTVKAVRHPLEPGQ